ncbi:hypothetical protein [Psychromonas aquatilis]|uniref:Uncharacterized protein n=1 Tax=Psychromonas aquatilis TaxID=2005072 RepID=A0ABU9GM87_9GAMM
MTNIHQISRLPKQPTINLISSYGEDFNTEKCDYHELLAKLQSTIMQEKFMVQQDNTHWMDHIGHDYIDNPKLFAHAPLTYICALLSEMFKHNSIEKIEKNIPPSVFSAILKRLEQFQ